MKYQIFYTDQPLRLQNITACVIVKSDMNCQILAKTPAPLFKILLEAYLSDCLRAYDNFDDYLDKDLSGLPELIYHWPHEELVLMESVTIRSHLSYCALLDCLSLDRGNIQEDSDPFEFDVSYCIFSELNVRFNKLANNVVEAFMSTSNDRFHERHQQKFNCKIRKINLSGLHTFDYKNVIEIVDWLELVQQSKVEKIELILDICINLYKPFYFQHEFNHNYKDGLSQIVNYSSKSYSMVIQVWPHRSERTLTKKGSITHI